MTWGRRGGTIEGYMENNTPQTQQAESQPNQVSRQLLPPGQSKSSQIVVAVLVILLALMAIAYLGIFRRPVENVVRPDIDIPVPSVGEYSPKLSPSVPRETEPTPSGGGGVYCTAEVMECPDGSYVGRQPPTCEFSPCK